MATIANDFTIRWGTRLAAVLALGMGASSCGYHHYSTPLRPIDDQGTAMTVADDGSVTFTQDRLEVRLRPLTDEELNRQFASQSKDGPQSTNPYTFGNTEFWEGDKTRSRFTVFHLAVKNYAYPKVRIDPAKIVLRAQNKREYWSLNLQQLDTYYRAYAIGYRGNEYARYQARIDLLRQTMFKNEEVFSGQEVEGFVVFEALHPDVNNIQVLVQDCVLRFDYRNEPIEDVDIPYSFERDIGKEYADGEIVVER
jgi:hypothetical protein